MCRNLRQKKGKGIYCREYHWTESKAIRPLSTLAEVETLEGSCTMSGHFFANCNEVGQIEVKKLSCLNCPGCKLHNYQQCENTGMCGSIVKRPVTLKSQARDTAPETRHCEHLKAAGRQRAVKVEEGMLVGSECADDREPYIISLALSNQQSWQGPDDSSWMGRIKEGTLKRILLQLGLIPSYAQSGRVYLRECCVVVIRTLKLDYMFMTRACNQLQD